MWHRLFWALPRAPLKGLWNFSRAPRGLCHFEPTSSYESENASVVCNNNNLWRWMSRLRYRRRTQQSAITPAKGRISRINRMLNASCAFRLVLEACLCQGVDNFPRPCVLSTAARRVAFLSASDCLARRRTKFSCTSQQFASVSYKKVSFFGASHVAEFCYS